MRSLLIAVLLGCSAASAIASCPPATCLTVPAHRTSAANAEKVIVGIAAAEGLPSISAAVAIDGKVVWSRAIGDADLETRAPANRRTKYRIGSVSKLLTAAAVMRLADTRRLDLDAPVQQYVPTFPQKEHYVTLRQLLGHLAGVRHYAPTDPMHERRFFDPNHYETTTDALTIFSSDPLLFTPGSRYLYSSYGYNLAGAAVEAVTKSAFDDAVRELVTQPLRLDDIVADDIETIVRDRARGYRRAGDAGLANSNSADSCYKWPSGGLLATPESLVRFASAHLDERCPSSADCGFLSANAKEQIFVSQRLADGTETGVGLGWRIAKRPDDRVVYHHGGLIEGGRAFLLLDPSRRIAVAIATNIEAKFALEEAMKIAEAFGR